VKLLLLLAFLLSLALLRGPSAVQIGLCFVYLIGTILLARLPWLAVLKQSLLVIPIVGFFALVIYLSGDLPRAVSILCKTYLSGLAVIICAASTPLPKVMQAGRLLRAPGFLLDVTQLIYRYLFVLTSEFRAMRTAFFVRAGQAGPRTFRSASGIVAVLFGRAYRRATVVDTAMLSRGFSGVLPTPPKRSLALKDFAVLFAGITGLILLRIA
jgi:cobalt/nickel transport system permease protein